MMLYIMKWTIIQPYFKTQINQSKTYFIIKGYLTLHIYIITIIVNCVEIIFFVKIITCIFHVAHRLAFIMLSRQFSCWAKTQQFRADLNVYVFVYKNKRDHTQREWQTLWMPSSPLWWSKVFREYLLLDLLGNSRQNNVAMPLLKCSKLCVVIPLHFGLTQRSAAFKYLIKVRGTSPTLIGIS